MRFDVHQGHVLEVLRRLPDSSVNCVVTSPPYWALRDYGTDPVPWPAITYAPLAGLPPCVEVPAMDASLGLEPTLEAFVGHIVLVFREVRRVLRKDGCLWVNMGDAYAGSRCGGHTAATGLRNPGQKIDQSAAARKIVRMSRVNGGGPQSADLLVPRSDVQVSGLKPKEMMGQPWRVALALQADGWYLRQDVIWNKLNPMPESVRDRCTKAHEYLFFFSKSRRYWSDFSAIKEPVSGGAHPRKPGNKAHKGTDAYAAGDESHRTKGGLVAYAERKRKLAEPGHGIKKNTSFEVVSVGDLVDWRNARDVWSMASEPFKEAHFATFPSELPRRCIVATCPPGGVVLDPFNGSGTTGVMAHVNGRHYVGVELSPRYIELTHKRVRGRTAGLPLEVVAA